MFLDGQRVYRATGSLHAAIRSNVAERVQNVGEFVGWQSLGHKLQTVDCPMCAEDFLVSTHCLLLMLRGEETLGGARSLP